MRSFSINRLILGLVISAFGMAATIAADVTVQSHGSTVSILGSPKGDDFRVSSNGGVVVVHSISQGTTINGKTEVTIRNGSNMNIRIDLGAGNDTCELQDLICLSLSIVDGLKADKNADTIRLNNVEANGMINVQCFGGDDLLTLDAVGAGLSLNIATGEGNDIAVLYDIATEDVWISMEAGDDMVLAGEFDCSNVKILGGTDTWTRADSFNRLAFMSTYSRFPSLTYLDRRVNSKTN
jgi:hypothetical protein